MPATADILKANLERIDSDCEGTASPDVTHLHRQARYDGSRFHTPSFGDAAKVWLSIISRKEHDFIEEIKRVLATPGTYLGADEISSVRTLVERLLAEERYVDRMRLFAEGVARTAASYGLKFDTDSINLAEAAYQAGAKNALRSARARISDELELQHHAAAPEVVHRFSRWWRYAWSHPWRWFAVVVLLAVLWALSSLDLPTLVQWFSKVRGEASAVGL